MSDVLSAVVSERGSRIYAWMELPQDRSMPIELRRRQLQDVVDGAVAELDRGELVQLLCFVSAIAQQSREAGIRSGD